MVRSYVLYNVHLSLRVWFFFVQFPWYSSIPYRIVMSHLACPLCGLNAPLSTLDPSKLDLDLTLKEFKGLGRGKGFKSLPPISVLGDDKYTPMIFNRIADLCTMFYTAGCSAPDGCIFAKVWAAEKKKSIIELMLEWEGRSGEPPPFWTRAS